MKKYFIWLTIASCFLAVFVELTQAQASISFVNATNTKEVVGAVSSSSVTLPVTAGNLIFVLCRNGSYLYSKSSTIDTIGNVFATSTGINPSGIGIVPWFAISSGTNANDVIQCRWSPNATYEQISVSQYSGILSSKFLDVSNTNSDFSGATTSTSHSFTTASSTELVIFAGSVGGTPTFSAGSTANGTAMSLRIPTVAGSDSFIEDAVVTSTLTNATATIFANAGETWATAIDTFRATSTSGGSGPPPTISSFTAIPATTSYGGASTLSWSITGVSSTALTITPGSFSSNATSGTTTVNPTSTTIYTLTATSNFVSSTAATTVTVDSTPPSAPTNLTITTTTVSAVALSWASSTDNISVSGYEVFRNSIQVTTTSVTNFTDTGLSASTTYTYVVEAFDEVGNVSGQSSSTQATTLPPSGSTPPTISSFTASPATIFTTHSSTLSWSVTSVTSTIITISPGGFSSSTTVGSTSVTPSVTTVYTLTAATSLASSTATTTVTVDPLPVGGVGANVTGTLDSATFDTGIALGSQYNSILWQGTQPASTTVQFQFATSNSSSGPWSFVGPGGAANTYFTPSGPNTTISFDNNLFNNQRYFRYRVYLSSNSIWPNGYSYRRTITINHSKVPNTDQTNFPMLFSGTYPSLKGTIYGGAVTNSNGYDIIFTSDATGYNLLPYEREQYVPSTGQVAFWVNVPIVSHTMDTPIYMFYNDPSISTDQSNSTGVWDSNYLSVYHMDDSAANTTVIDSTVNARNGTAVANTNTKSVPGKLATALSFDGAVDTISSTQVSTLGSGSGYLGKTHTFEAWIDASGTMNNFQRIISFVSSTVTSTLASGNPEFELRMGGIPMTPDQFDTNAESQDPNPISSSVWHSLAGIATYSDTTGTYNALYVDGILVATDTSGGELDDAGSIMIGSRNDSSWFYQGNIQEVKISNSIRSGDWIAAEYNNQSSPSTFYTLGPSTIDNNPTVNDVIVNWSP